MISIKKLCAALDILSMFVSLSSKELRHLSNSPANSFSSKTNSVFSSYFSSSSKTSNSLHFSNSSEISFEPGIFVFFLANIKKKLTSYNPEFIRYRNNNNIQSIKMLKKLTTA